MRKCISLIGLIPECLGAMAKIAILAGTGGLDCDGERLCQTVLSCAIDGVLVCMCDLAMLALLAGLGIEGPMGAFLAGCLCGGITSAIHYLMDLACNKMFGCKPKGWSLPCLFLNIALGTIAGCAGTFLPESMKKKVREYILGIGNGIFDGGVDRACEEYGFE